ncbi:MAG: NADP-dependent malic enzyme [Magnetovibrionaceae bacterium]
MSDSFEKMALEYHRLPKAGKLEIKATKPLSNQRDLALAYSPGVAAACQAIVDDPSEISSVTAKGNLVAVITNGSAVLGLGNIGPDAAKPVMEGKAVLFKKFAGIDVFDIEIKAETADEMIETIARLEPTFGAINLEDIKSPECFEVERALRSRMNIPVFHDDQHGTAIVAGAAMLNGLRVVGKDLGQVKVVSTGGGAAGIACLNLFVDMGIKRENIWLCDHVGLVHEGRETFMNPEKAAFAQKTDLRRLDQVIADADVFLGLSAPGVLTADMVKGMAAKPVIMALANPTPEIMPDDIKAVRSDAVIATGRSDYPNQVNNVLCFPFIFRGALDVGATDINEEMKVACVKALADLAKAESSEVVAAAYSGEDLTFGPDYLIPKPFDPRLIAEIAPAVAEAAMRTGVATRPIADMAAYREELNQFVFRSGMLMKPVFERARQDPKRLVFAEGEEERVLRAVQVLLDDGIAKPILVGRPDVIEKRVHRLGLRIGLGDNVEVCNPEDDPRFDAYWHHYHALMGRNGVSPDAAKAVVRGNTTAIAAIMLARGEADAMICGTFGQYNSHLASVLDIVGKREGVGSVSALSALVMGKGTFFLADTHVQAEPTSEQIAESVLLSAEEIRRFGMTPRAALISHSNFGSNPTESSRKMRRALEIVRHRAPDLEIDGEMHASSALNPDVRQRILPSSTLKGQANLLVFANLDAANSAFNLLINLGDALPIGPILVGADKAVHILTPAVSARGIVNMATLAVVDAQNNQARPDGGL